MTLLLPKHRRTRCKPFLAWLHDQQCAVLGCYGGPIHAHHLRGDGSEPLGLGVKSSDEAAVPLCAAHHGPGYPGCLHEAPDKRSWWRERGVADPAALAASYHREWRLEQQAGGPV